MDHVAAVAQAVVLAGSIGAFLSIAQERFLGKRLEGNAALIASVIASTIIGVLAVTQTGGFVLVVDGRDPITTATSILANAAVVLAASQAAFRILVRPVAEAIP